MAHRAVLDQPLRESSERGDVASPGGAAFSLVVIGSSWGGVSALPELIGALPADFPLPILVCHHVLRSRPTMMPAIIGRRSRLPVRLAEDGVRPLPGTVHVASSDRHLLVRPDGRLGLSDGERVNWCRPAIDVLFQSAAAADGAGVIGVVLSGLGRDGAMGSRAIRRSGGFVIAQDEASAEQHDMPLAARDIGGADLVLPLGQMAAALEALARHEEGAAPGTAVPTSGGRRGDRPGSTTHAKPAACRGPLTPLVRP